VVVKEFCNQLAYFGLSYPKLHLKAAIGFHMHVVCGFYQLAGLSLGTGEMLNLINIENICINPQLNLFIVVAWFCGSIVLWLSC
jgi:hypothetical protein